MNSPSRHLWRLLDQIRSENRDADLVTLIRIARERGVVGEKDLALVATAYIARFGGPFPHAEFVDQFIADYLAPTPPESVLDPFAGIGSSLAFLVRRFHPRVAIGIERVVELVDAARYLFGSETINWRAGDALHDLASLHQTFDAIIGNPPWGGQPQEAGFPDPDHPPLPGIALPELHELQLRDEPGNLGLLRASLRLSPNGAAFFVVPPSFFFRRHPRGVAAYLGRFGLFVHAALALPSSVFPATVLNGVLVIIRREPAEQLFAGELVPDPNRRATLLANLRAGREGREPQLGVLADPATFIGLGPLIAQREIQDLSHRLGFAPRPLSEVSPRINFLHARDESAFSDLPNAVYLPLIGRSRAVTSHADMTLKHHNYAQMLVDSEQVIPDYLARFFNTPLGLKIRESLEFGGTIRHVGRTALRAATVYLPDPERQEEALHLDTEITNISSRLEEVRHRLWTTGARPRQLQQQLRAITRGDDWLDWFETLPFPLGSVLWTYHSSTGYQRVDALILFFEALSQFTVTLLLSGLTRLNHPDLERGDAVVDPADSPYARASFGAWNTIVRQLGNEIRRLLSGEQRAACLEAFGSPDPGFLDMIVSTRLFDLLDEALPWRNDWKGHGGAVSERTANSRLITLQDHLAKTRTIISDRYADASLLLPGPSEFREGIYHHRARKAVGTRTPFQIIVVETLTPMDTTKMYLLHQGQKQPMEVVPLFRIMPSPNTEMNACYFYNRLEPHGIHWVSYHFEPEPFVDQPDPAAQEAVSSLAALDRRRPW
jgi:hypothetical protein